MANGPKNRIVDRPLTDLSVGQLEKILRAKLKSLIDAKLISGVTVDDTDNTYRRMGKEVGFVSMSVLYGEGRYIDFMVTSNREVAMSSTPESPKPGRWYGGSFAVYVQGCITAHSQPSARTASKTARQLLAGGSPVLPVLSRASTPRWVL